jgi:hypothetical protein
MDKQQWYQLIYSKWPADAVVLPHITEIIAELAVSGDIQKAIDLQMLISRLLTDNLNEYAPNDLRKILTNLKRTWFYASTEKFCEFHIPEDSTPISIAGEIPKMNRTLSVVRLERMTFDLPDGTAIQLAKVEPSHVTANNQMLQELLWVKRFVVE